MEQINDTTMGKRGLAWSMDLPHGRSLLSTPLIVDGVMYFTGSYSVARAVDAKTGKTRWSTQTTDVAKPVYITGHPTTFRGLVLVGNGGTENGASRGYVSAYHITSGKLAWKFYIVSGNPADGLEDDVQAMAANTWTGEWWKHGGGGNAWNGFPYDPEFDQILIGTGNGSPWNRKVRNPDGGDNLFLCSIVALDASTGKYK